MADDHKLVYEWEESEIDVRRRIQEKKEFEVNLAGSQRDVLEYHRYSNHPFISKVEHPIGPNCLYENGKVRFYVCMEMVANGNDKVSFLPDLCYEVGTYYAFSMPLDRLVGDGRIGSDRLSQRIKTGEGNTVIRLPMMKTIFDVRNVYVKGGKYYFTATPEVKESSLDSVVEDVEAGFRLSIASSTQGMLVSYMDILNPNAEEIILKFFKTIGKEFAEYQNLQGYSEEETKRSLKLWTKEALKGWQHWGDRKLLHTSLFGKVRKVLKKSGLEVETTYKVTDIARTVMKKQGIDVDEIRDRVKDTVKKEIEDKLGLD